MGIFRKRVFIPFQSVEFYQSGVTGLWLWAVEGVCEGVRMESGVVGEGGGEERMELWMEGGRGWRKRGGRVCTELNPSCVALLDKPSSYGSRQAPGDRNSDIWSVSSRRIHGKNSISPAQQDPTTSKFLLKQHHKGAWRVATFDLFRTAEPQTRSLVAAEFCIMSSGRWASKKPVSVCFASACVFYRCVLFVICCTREARFIHKTAHCSVL